MNLRSTSSIGIDLGADRIRAVRCSLSGGAPVIRETLNIPRSGATLDREIARLGGVMSRRGLGASDVRVALPDEDMLGSCLELPPRASGAPLEQIAAIELGRIFRHDPATIEVALWELPAMGRSAGAACQYYAVGCQHAVTDPLAAAFNAQGMVVRAVEPRMASLARVRRCYGPVRDQAPLEAEGVLEVGFFRSQLIVLHHGQLIDCRPCSGPGIRGLAEGLATIMGADVNAGTFVLRSLARDGAAPQSAGADAPDGNAQCPWWMHSARLHREVSAQIARFVEQSAVDVAALLDYVRHRFGGMQCRTLTLTGEYCRLPGLAWAIEAHTGLAPSGLGMNELIGSEDGAFAAAVGMALAGLESAA